MNKLEFLRDAREIWHRAHAGGLPGGAALALAPEASLRLLSRLVLRRGAARLVRWHGDAGRGMWTEIRWPGRRRICGMALRVLLPDKGGPGLLRSLEWTARLAETIDALCQGPAPIERPIRLHVCSPSTLAAVEPGRAWAGGRRDDAAVEVDLTRYRLGQTRAVAWAKGLVGEVLAAAFGKGPAESAGLPLTRTRLYVAGGEEASRLGAALASTALWWATAGVDEAYRLLEWLQETAPDSVRAYAAAHPASHAQAGALPDALAYALEARLDGMWQLAAHFEPESVGEEEMAGWVREVEAAFRYGLEPGRLVPVSRAKVPAHDAEALQGRDLAWVASDARRPAARGRRAKAARRLSLGGIAVPAPGDVFDGERTLAEGVRLMWAEWGLPERAAWKVAKHWIKSGLIEPVGRTGSGRRSLLYFAFGSCMYLPSFRETIPRYDLIGPARLRGHRLGFTFESVGRSGGVADILPSPGDEVWGVLYRIPRSYLPRLDAREGVRIGHYQRSWVDVEALGITWRGVLTYTVVNKARSEIRPSEEYAGLIMAGAQTLLGPDYCARLAELFARFGVEPSLPA